jgi:hypothetical protein
LRRLRGAEEAGGACSEDEDVGLGHGLYEYRRGGGQGIASAKLTFGYLSCAPGREIRHSAVQNVQFLARYQVGDNWQAAANCNALCMIRVRLPKSS